MKKTNEIKEVLKKGDYKDLLTDIYVDESRIEYQTCLLYTSPSPRD